MRIASSGRIMVLGLLYAAAVATATAAPYLLVSGRWDNTLVVIDLAKAMDPANDGTPSAIVNRVRVTPDLAPLPLVTTDKRPSRPRGIAITPEGKYAAITGAPRGEPGSGMLWVVDIAQRKTVGRVSGVGNVTYLLALLP